MHAFTFHSLPHVPEGLHSDSSSSAFRVHRKRGHLRLLGSRSSTELHSRSSDILLPKQLCCIVKLTDFLIESVGVSSGDTVMGSEGQMNSDGSQGPYEAFFKSVSFTHVFPPSTSTPQHPDVLNPNHLDHFHMDRYVPVLFAYQLADNTDETYQKYSDQLKNSLSKALVAFYPVAGRVLQSSDPHHPRQFSVKDQGVPFSEAVLEQPMGPFLNLPHFEPRGYLSGFEPAGLDSFKQLQAFQEDGNALAFMQITRFSCGGVILCYTYNHMLADMSGAVDFIKAWAEISRVGATGISPDHNRAILSPKSEESPISSSPAVPPPASSPALPPPTSSSPAKATEVKPKSVGDSALTRIYRVRREPIEKIKQEVRVTNPEVSTLDCLSAHLWRCLSKVNFKIGQCESTLFSSAVEGRSRMGISAEYFGNCIASAKVLGVPAEDITSGPLAHPASLIRKAIRGVTKDAYLGMIKEMDLSNPWKTGYNRSHYQLGLTSWMRFGLDDLDFGFGKPVFVGANLLAQNARNGQCLVMPTPEGNFHVSVCLSHDTHDALANDAEFVSVL